MNLICLKSKSELQEHCVGLFNFEGLHGHEAHNSLVQFLAFHHERRLPVEIQLHNACLLHLSQALLYLHNTVAQQLALVARCQFGCHADRPEEAWPALLAFESQNFVNLEFVNFR